MNQSDTGAAEPPDAPTFEAKLDRALDEAFLVQLRVTPSSGNRAERREHARAVRRAAGKLRAWARGVKATHALRSARKARRAARAARKSPVPL